MKIIYLLTTLIIFSTPTWSQKRAKFGKPTMEELKMEFYEKDSSANAVILYDYGNFDKTEFLFTRHLRIKILNKEGLSFANWTLYTASQSDFKGVTSNLTSSDELEQIKLEQSSVYDEEFFEGRKRYKIFFKGVKVGSVIDLKYSFSGMPYEWRFQDIIPIKFSELKISESQYITFNRRAYGFREIPEVEYNHWIVKDAPAIISEPHAGHYSNFISKLEFEVSSIQFPGYSRSSRGYYKEFSTTWDEVSEELLDYNNFGGIIRGSNFLNEKAKELKSSNLSLDQKINAAYAYIKENIKWNGSNSVSATRAYLSNFKEKHSGNSAEVNLSLLALLKKADIQAWPVVLSTRSNGLLTPFFPSLNKLNYVAVCIRSGDQNIFLDATMDYLSVGILPPKCLNGQGWLVDKDYGEWVDLQQGNLKQTTIHSSLAVNEDDEWEASLLCIRKGYDYLNWKAEREDFSSERNYLKSLEESHEGWFIDDYQKSKDDSTKRVVQEKFTINIADNVGEQRNEVVIYPFVVNSFDSNPFKSKDRNFPIDFINKEKLTVGVMIDVPEGMQIKHLPKSEKITIEEAGTSVSYLIQENFGKIQVQLKYDRNRIIFAENEYEIVKSFYSKVVELMNKPIVLTKQT